jgi:hypothetical protein
MNAKNKQITLLDRAKSQLQALAPNVSRGDKKDAATECGVSTMTVHRYLSNDVRELDTATKLIRFFKRRIQARERELAA